MNETQFITIPIAEYQQLITAVQEISKLRDENKALEDYIEARFAAFDRIDKILASQSEYMGRLRDEFENYQERNELDRAYDRKRIAALEKVEPQPRQLNQSEVLRALLAANGGKMLQSVAREKMNLSQPDFSRLLVTMKNEVKSKPYYKDQRKNILELR